MSQLVEGATRTFKTAADLSTSLYLIVKESAANTVALAAASTDFLVGVVDVKPAAFTGANVQVRLRSGCGTMKVKLGGTVAIGDKITSNASGQGITTTTGGDEILGRALAAGVSGDVIEIMPCIDRV